MKPLLSDSLFKQPRSIFAGTKIDQITYAGGRLKKNVGLRSLIRLFKALKLLNVVVYLFTFFSWSSKKEASHLLGTNWLPKTWATWATWPTKDKKLRNPTHRHTRTHGRTDAHTQSVQSVRSNTVFCILVLNMIHWIKHSDEKSQDSPAEEKVHKRHWQFQGEEKNIS